MSHGWLIYSSRLNLKGKIKHVGPLQEATSVITQQDLEGSLFLENMENQAKEVWKVARLAV